MNYCILKLTVNKVFNSIQSFTPLNTLYSQQNMIASPAQTPSVWLLVSVLVVAKDTGVHGEHSAPENELTLGR